MPNPDLGILVMDAAKFFSAMLGRALSQAGCQDPGGANHAAQAIRPAVGWPPCACRRRHKGCRQ